MRLKAIRMEMAYSYSQINHYRFRRLNSDIEKVLPKPPTDLYLLDKFRQNPHGEV